MTPLPADVLSGCYCDQQLRFLGGGRQVPPRFKLRRVGPRPFTVGVVNSFGGGFVWILWLTLSAIDPEDDQLSFRTTYLPEYPAWAFANYLARVCNIRSGAAKCRG